MARSNTKIIDVTGPRQEAVKSLKPRKSPVTDPLINIKRPCDLQLTFLCVCVIFACLLYIHILILTSLPVGNWRPGEIPTKELLTLISSRIKTQQKKGVIREAENPQVPSLVLEQKHSYSEDEDRVNINISQDVGDAVNTASFV